MSSISHSAMTAFGKYTLVELLGRGGMAEVWKAKISGPAGFERLLVVKRILPHLVEDGHFVRMFLAEARLSARLHHANIVQVFELGNVDREYFIAMEYVRGRDLVRVLRKQQDHGLPSPGLGALVTREVCRALSYAHALVDDGGAPLRIIHRDVSPSNIMLSYDGTVKLLDFGIAKMLAEVGENRTQTGTLKGKFGYLSPEQVEGRPIDHRADLFAAGVVLHEALTGRRLFKGNGDLQTIALVREAQVPLPSQINPEVPPELDRICLKALAREVEDRYSHCDEMAVELDRVVHQLEWGPARLKALLQDLFPGSPGGDEEAGEKTPYHPPPPLTPVRPRRRSFALSALGVGGITLPLWLLFSLRSGAKRPTPPPKPTSELSAPVDVTAPPTPSVPQVLVEIRSTPSGAEVFVDKEARLRGVTPCELSLPHSGSSLSLLIKAKGYLNKTVPLVPDRDARLEIALIPLETPAPQQARRLRKKSTIGNKTSLDLRGGDVVNPFER